MKVFAISDQHYGHENIIKYCNRPYTNAAENAMAMIEAHNQTVGDDDLVIFVGDVSASAQGRRWIPKIIPKLKGRKILVRGNHDHLSEQQYIDAGFERVVEILKLNDFLFCHFPDHPEVCKMVKERNLTLVCGHTHKPFNFNDEIPRINVAVDVCGIQPLLITEIDNG